MSIDILIVDPRMGEKLLNRGKIESAKLGRFKATGNVAILATVFCQSLTEAKRLQRLNKGVLQFVPY